MSILVIFFVAENTADADNNGVVDVVISENSKWSISPYLATIHLLYTNAADGVYNNGTMGTWVKEKNIRSARYPGGTVAAYWDWENPCGGMGCWSLDPDFDESQVCSIYLNAYLYYTQFKFIQASI